MEELNTILSDKAYTNFVKDLGSNKSTCIEFILKNATLKEFVEYFLYCKDVHGHLIINSYSSNKMEDFYQVYFEFCEKLLWPRMKEKYIKNVIFLLEHQILTSKTK